MATETWPITETKPNVEYSITPQDEVLETQYETGTPLQRLRFDTHFELVNVSWLLTDIEYLVFKNWFASKLARGTKKFNIDLPLGDDLQTYEAQWVSGNTPYKANYQQVLYWQVSATLRIQDTNELPYEMVDVYIDELPNKADETIPLAADALDNYIEVILPNSFG